MWLPPIFFARGESPPTGILKTALILWLLDLKKGDRVGGNALFATREPKSFSASCFNINLSRIDFEGFRDICFHQSDMCAKFWLLSNNSGINIGYLKTMFGNELARFLQ